MTTMDFHAQLTQERGRKLQVSVDAALFFVLLAIIFAIRVTNIRYNTLFVDEAIYVTIGKDALSGMLDRSVNTWVYGSYLYPVLAAVADAVGGDIALRGLSALLSTSAAVFVFLTARRLFDQQTALWAMLIFGLADVSLELGQYAVYDTLAVCLLTASLYYLIRAASFPRTNETVNLLAAGFCFTLATFSKYLSVLYLPAMLCLGLILYLLRRRPTSPLFSKFLGAAILPFGLYAFIYYQDLIILLSGNFGVQLDDPWAIIQIIWPKLDLVIFLALAGCSWLLLSVLQRVIAGLPQRTQLWLMGLIPLLCLSIFAAPVYHLISTNLHAAWKHTIFSLIFLSPLAGYGCAAPINYIRRQQGHRYVVFSIVGLIITLVGLIGFINQTIDQNRQFQHQWPNVSRVVDYLRQQELTPGQPVLAEGAQIYEYYFDFGPQYDAMWQDTWYFNYGSRQGVEAMTAAIRDRRFDFVVLDGYYTPEIRQDLTTALGLAGYTVGYKEVQILSSNESVLIQVYTSPKLAEDKRKARG